LRFAETTLLEHQQARISCSGVLGILYLTELEVHEH
jgi:hypothetical protein